MILYLHGFLSSPGSRKAQMLREAMAVRGRAHDFACPALPVAPRQAIEAALAAAGREQPGRLALIGSSLGGYYATWLAERLNCSAVLLNPAIAPAADLAAHLGQQQVFFADQTVELTADHLEQLRALDTPRITRPERYFLLAATGDEVIDWTTMAAKYAGCRQRVIQGSDHALSGFERYLDDVIDFCDQATSKGELQ